MARVEGARRNILPRIGLPSGLLHQTGRMFALTLDAFRAMPRRPVPFEEFVRVSWFIASVSIVPVILVSLAFGMVTALQVGNVARQLGAHSQTGAAMVLAVVREAAPIATALLIAGAGGSAMTADLGSRKIREEIDAMEVLGVDPVHRLVVPRIWASMFVAVLLNGFVSVAGDTGHAHESVEQDRDEHRRPDARDHEPVDGVDAEDLHRVDLLADLARSEVGRHRRTAGAGDQQRRRDRCR